MSPEVLVIGSGASGVAATWALLGAGVRVRMLDGGLRMEPERAAAAARLREIPRTNWSADDLRAARGAVVPTSRGVDDKLVFGSDFFFRGMDKFHPIRLVHSKMYQSLAEGGLTNTWGAAILPALDDDLGGWPIRSTDLAPHYESVLRHLPLAARADDLAEQFPIYDPRRRPARLSRQALALLADLDAHRDGLARAGFTYGQSRLAVDADPVDNKGGGCVACGMCMYGCPWDLIWSSRQALPSLRANDGFTYIGGQYVERLVESNGGVDVEIRALQDGSRTKLHAERVVLAAGIVSSTRVLLQSLEAFDRPVRIRHSEHFHFPMVRLKGVSDVAVEPLHTLCQVFLELQDARVSANTVHLQVYTYNDFFSQIIEGYLGASAGLFGGPTSMILGRLLLVQGYLHSDASSHVIATLAGGADGVLRLEGVPNSEAQAATDRVIAKLSDQWRALGSRPVPGMVTISMPGVGNHSGGSFPMRERPAPFESDVLGRPSGFKRVHVVDSTVLPSVPATTVTLTVMANAHRIGARMGAELTGAPTDRIARA